MGGTSGDLKRKAIYTPPPSKPITEVFTREGVLTPVEHIELKTEIETMIEGTPDFPLFGEVTTPSVDDADLVPDEVELDTMTQGFEGQNSGYFPEDAQGSTENPATGFNLEQILNTGELSKLLPFGLIVLFLSLTMNRLYSLALIFGVLYFWWPKKQSTEPDIGVSMLNGKTDEDKIA